MGVVTHNGKVVIAPNGKALNYNSLIDAANAVTGEDDKTLADAIDTLIDGYGEPELQQKTASLSTSDQQITADAGYDGLSEVSVPGIDGTALHQLDHDFSAENIRSGKNLFGVTGTYPVTQSRTVSPSTTPVTVLPQTGYDTLSQVVVNAVTKELLASLDADFVAGNIKSGVNLFGLTGTAATLGLMADSVWTGTVTIASGGISQELSHGLGVSPDFVLAVKKDFDPSVKETVFYFCVKPNTTTPGESIPTIRYMAYNGTIKYADDPVIIGSGVSFTSTTVEIHSAQIQQDGQVYNLGIGDYDLIVGTWRTPT